MKRLARYRRLRAVFGPVWAWRLAGVGVDRGVMP